MNFDFFNMHYWELLSDSITQWSIKVAPGVIAILIGTTISLWIINSLLKRVRKIWFDNLKNSSRFRDVNELEKRADTLFRVLFSSIKIIVWTMVFIIVLKKLGVDIGPLLASAGIAGIAIGFGAQELVRDFISGFFILLENQVRTGDVAIINGTGGLVESIGLRTIILRDLSGVVHIFQNGKINSLSNMTKEWSAMVFNIGVAYKEDTDTVVEVMKMTAEGMRKDDKFKESLIEDMEVFGVEDFSDSAVIIKARLKTKPIKQWEIGREYRRRLKKAFDEQGIVIPFPHRTIYWGADVRPVTFDTE